MRKHLLPLLALMAPWFCRCTGNTRVHEVGQTRMIFEPPSLSRAETEAGRRMALKAEFGNTFQGNYTGVTDAVSRDDVDVKPGFPGNLSVMQGESPLLVSLAFRITETSDFFVQGESAPVAGTYASVWLLGYRTETDPEGFSAFLEGGFGLLDLYLGTTLEKYDELPPFLIFSGSKDYVGSETLSESRFVPFPHMGGGLKARFRSGLHLLAKMRTLYVYDAFDLGAQAFLNSVGTEAEIALARWLSVHAAAELQANTLKDSRTASSVGLGFTLRPW